MGDNATIFINSRCHDCIFLLEVHSSGTNDWKINCVKEGIDIFPRLKCKKFGASA